MYERELIIQEFWKRLAAVDGVKYTARNPKDPPSVENLPAVQFFEVADRVEKVSSRGAASYPVYHRRMGIVVEVFINGETEGSASKELSDLVTHVKRSLYSDGNALGRLRAELVETEAGRFFRPPVGGPVIGVALAFDVRYLEDVGRLF